MRILKSKGQLSLSDAPTIILIVGLTFLVMATIAMIGERYGNALDVDATGSVVNQTMSANTTMAGGTVYFPDSVRLLKDVSCSITRVNMINSTITLTAANYTKPSAYGGCGIATVVAAINNTRLNVTYTYSYSALNVAANVTDDMNTELSNNTSIAGIILTISLVGIVLTILIGVFMGVRNRI